MFTRHVLIVVSIQHCRSSNDTALLANRRYIGVSYAASHAVHAGALVALAGASTEFVGSLDATTLVGGGLAYVFTLGMAATSSDAAVRALGRKNWSRLHVAGGWYIWIIFALTFLPLISIDRRYLIAGAIVMAIPVLRLSARVRRRAEQPQAA